MSGKKEDENKQLIIKLKEQLAEANSAVDYYKQISVESGKIRLKETSQLSSLIDKIKKEQTRRQQLEDQLIQSQKMEAIGRLAGGVAHDMNNVLAAIKNFASMLAEDLDTNSEYLESVEGIISSVDRGRDLTRNLLGFARKGKYVEKQFSIKQVICQIKLLLERTVSKTISLEIALDDSADIVYGDPNQVKNALMNICINAIDAMTDKGTLSISTKKIEIDSDTQPSSDTVNNAGLNEPLENGRYILIEIADNGVGINPETLKHVFEPFFSTKAQNEGTGLGLSMVYGTIKNHNGKIGIESEEGVGTTVFVYFPAADVEEGQSKGLLKRDDNLVATGIANSQVLTPGIEQSGKSSQSFQVPASDAAMVGNAENADTVDSASTVGTIDTIGTKGTILLVDDEPLVQKSTMRILSRLGYSVIVASDGKEGLAKYKKAPIGEISLVLLDLMMPNMDGEEMFFYLKQYDPLARVFIISGYSKTGKAKRVLASGALGLLEKPFDSVQLTAIVRQSTGC